MKQLYPDLWVTEPEVPFPEFPDLTMCAYLLERDGGNVLFSRSEHAADHRAIKDHGGITRQYLTHWHEAGPGLARIKEMFGSKLVAHRLAEPRTSKFSAVDLPFDKPEVQLGCIEVIPSPGHTPGSTCFLYKSPHGKSYLFAGDTLYPSRGGWEAIVLEDGNAAQLKNSLTMLRGLTPDVLLCGAAVADTPFREMTQATWHAALEQAALALDANTAKEAARR
jgi:hydroxyacylglutathione hydrolase